MSNVHRLYVGLSREGETKAIDSEDVVSWLAGHFDAFTVTPATGYFRGARENSLVITIADDDTRVVADMAQRLRAYLNQNGIGLEVVGTYQRITAV